MSRTLNGNLTGKAAQLERMDALEAAMERGPFSRRWHNAIDTLSELMGEDKFDEWFDSYPEDMPKGQFVLVMEAQINNLTVLESDADFIHAMIYEPAHFADEAQAEERRIEDMLSGNPERMAKYITPDKLNPKPYSSFPRHYSAPLSAEEVDGALILGE